jgi:PAS domain S-box-containing protein
MALQGAVSLTFGLAFLGLWRGFQRPTAIRWAAAWLTYSVGVVFTATNIGLAIGGDFGPVGRALQALPLQLGVVLFRAGTDSLVGRERVKAARYAVAGALIFGILIAFREVEALGPVAIHPSVGGFILPRVLMGLTYAWALWPLRALARPRWAEGCAVMAATLVCLSLRMFVSAGYEVWQIQHGAAGRPESLLLTVLQVCFLIAFGVATALVLVEAERLEAVRAAQTIQQTADALRASEARFRFVVEHSSDVQVIAGADGRIKYVAPSCERLIGLPPSAFEGRPFLNLIHPDDRESVRSAWARMQSDPQGRRPPTAIRIQHASGEWLPFDVSGQLVPQEGTGPAMVLSVRDMAAQRHLETILRQTRRMDALGRMAGNVAHDFNNTLTAVMGGLELAMENLPADSSMRRQLDLTQQAAQRGAALTRQLLTFARQMPASSERFDVRDRLAALEGMVGMAVGRSVRVRFELGQEALPVRADAGQFDQVIMNLAINARDAMPSGGQLTIVSKIGKMHDIGQPPVAAAPSCAQVVVEDTGVGIPAAIVDRIFEPFFTTKDEGRGTGLGLASAYGFARQAGGGLFVDSTEGVGTRFRLDLPLDRSEAA